MAIEVYAPAKVNLALHVTGQRGDGYHLLDSLVVFPAIGDVLLLEPADQLDLDPGFQQGREVGGTKGVETIGMHLGGTVAAEQFVVEEQTDSKHGKDDAKSQQRHSNTAVPIFYFGLDRRQWVGSSSIGTLTWFHNRNIGSYAQETQISKTFPRNGFLFSRPNIIRVLTDGEERAPRSS